MSETTNKTAARPLAEVSANSVSNSSNVVSEQPAVKKARTSNATKAPDKIYTFSFGPSPAHVQVSSANTLETLVAIAFYVCDPRDGEGADEHLWNLTIEGTRYESGDIPCKSELRAQETQLSDVADALHENATLELEYDYGSTSNHVFRLISIQDADDTFDPSDFPRRKPQETPPPASTFSTNEVDLNAAYPTFNTWATEASELNFFQAGRKPNVHGYFAHGGQMILLPDKALSLAHYMACLEQGAGTWRDPGYEWQSIVVLPAQSKKLNRYNIYLERGFCDCKTVAEPTSTPNLNQIFPKIAALAGFRKDKKIKKGWIRYTNQVLLVVSGAGSPVAHANAPKGTAFHGEGCHVPASECDIMFRFDKKMESIHEIFCVVEGLLGTL